ncbi:MAG: MFS transporter [Solirubrobacterales bacterium]|nr:MFS transporter [Solirubrobacterales bacterium]
MEALSIPAAAPAAAPRRARSGLAFLISFSLAAAGVGAARAITTSFLPVLLDRISDSPALIGAIMIVNAAAGFVVPLVVGIWSDRRGAGRFGRRVPFVIGGVVLSTGGAVAIALGTGTSYGVLALAAAATYIGLNAAATAHRALIIEGFDDAQRPAATSGQELAMLAGGLAGVVVGGALIATALWLPFVIAALALPLLTAPTVAAVLRRFVGRSHEHPSSAAAASASPRDLIAALRRPGVREILVAQTLWVASYAALPVFFVLYAERVLGLGPGSASLLLAAFGLVSGAGILLGGRARPEHVHPLLLAGAAMLGIGLLTSALFSSVTALAIPFATAALGFGLVSALGFPYFARFVPDGQSGRYSGLYFSARAIASTAALPLAGVVIELTGDYRMLMVQGTMALIALVPLARARERRARSYDSGAVLHPAAVRVAAVIPSFGWTPTRELVAETLRHVDRVVLVDDGSAPPVAEEIAALAALPRVELVRLAANRGKGSAVTAGAAALQDGDAPPDAIVVLDSDGQHPPERIPAFIEAARHSDVVVGNRLADTRGMPLSRRLANRVSSGLLSLALRQWIPDSQCGMRLYRTDALERVPLPAGRYEAETTHLKAAAAAGLPIGSVQIPAIYEGAPSYFRPFADSIRVLRAILAHSATGNGRPAPPGTTAAPELRTGPIGHRAGFAGDWVARLGVLVAAMLAVGAIVPLLAPLDERLFLAVNALGDGPGWLYGALDPHTRNYVVLSVLAIVSTAFLRLRWALGAAVAVILAAFLSDLLLQAAYLLYDRPRPEEVLGGEALLSHGRSWAHLASFPSGHMTVTAAIAAAAMAAVPALRRPLWIYVAAVAFTRVTFGAHFPLDVMVGTAFGYEIGRASAALAHRLGLLPAPVRPHASVAKLWCALRPPRCAANFHGREVPC